MTFNEWLEQKEIDEQWFNEGYSNNDTIYTININGRDLITLNNAMRHTSIDKSLHDIITEGLTEQFGIYDTEKFFIDEIDFWSVEYSADEIYDMDNDDLYEYGIPGAECMSVYDFDKLLNAEYKEYDDNTHTVYITSTKDLSE